MITNKFFLFLFLPLPFLIISGPFLPDLAISLMGIFCLFNFKTYFNLDALKNIKKFIIFLFIFYFFILLSSLLSEDILFSFESSFFYFRFIFFLVLSCSIISSNESFTKYFLYALILSFLVLSIDGIYEFIFDFNLLGVKGPENRISGLFGNEWIIGSYLIRLLPILVGLFLLNLKKINFTIKILSVSAIFLSSLTIGLSGERTALLLWTIFFFINFLFIIRNYKFNKLTFLMILILSIIISPIFLNDNLNKRITLDLKTHSSIDPNKSVYTSMYLTSFSMFVERPLLGHGPKMYRIKCDDFKKSFNSCNTHPHNFYMQLLAETGIIGFFFVFSFFIFLFYRIIIMFLFINKYKKNILNFFGILNLLIAIFINFWPLIPTGSFFNNRYSLFLYIPIVIYFSFLVKKDNKDYNFS